MLKDSNPVDTSVKKLFRQIPEAVLRLVGARTTTAQVRFEDTAINFPELRADQVFLIDEPPELLYFEYQLRPDPDQLKVWDAKRAGLQQQLGVPVVLTIIYLEKGDRASFPDRYTVSIAGLENEIRFTRTLLWDHVERIRSGELWQLAPFLVLCENNPTEATIRTALELILSADATQEVQANLLAAAIRVAERDFPRAILEAVFREVKPMAQGASFIDDLVLDREVQDVLRILRRRFQDVPEEVEAALRGIPDTARLDGLLDEAVDCRSLAEFGDVLKR